MAVELGQTSKSELPRSAASVPGFEPGLPRLAPLAFLFCLHVDMALTHATVCYCTSSYLLVASVDWRKPLTTIHNRHTNTHALRKKEKTTESAL